jgi:hypothetical protein
MGIFQYFTEQKKTVEKLKFLEAKMIDILAGVELQAAEYKGSQYQTYDSMVNALSQMYNGKSQWGSLFAKTIVDIRASLIAGGGIVIDAVGDKKLAERELEFIREFLEQNNLDQEAVQDWAKEGEIEGKFLCRLFAEKAEQRIEARFVPYTAFKYIIKTQPGDYAQYETAEYTNNETKQKIVLNKDEFIYKKLGGRTHMVNETPSKVAMILTQLENLDKA